MPDLAERGLVFRCLDDPSSEAWEELRAFTRNAVPAETTKNDFGYALYDANSREMLVGIWVAREGLSRRRSRIPRKTSSKAGMVVLCLRGAAS